MNLTEKFEETKKSLEEIMAKEDKTAEELNAAIKAVEDAQADLKSMGAK